MADNMVSVAPDCATNKNSSPEISTKPVPTPTNGSVTPVTDTSVETSTVVNQDEALPKQNSSGAFNDEQFRSNKDTISDGEVDNSAKVTTEINERIDEERLPMTSGASNNDNIEKTENPDKMETEIEKVTKQTPEEEAMDVTQNDVQSEMAENGLNQVNATSTTEQMINGEGSEVSKEKVEKETQEIQASQQKEADELNNANNIGEEKGNGANALKSGEANIDESSNNVKDEVEEKKSLADSNAEVSSVNEKVIEKVDNPESEMSKESNTVIGTKDIDTVKNEANVEPDAKPEGLISSITSKKELKPTDKSEMKKSNLEVSKSTTDIPAIKATESVEMQPKSFSSGITGSVAVSEASKSTPATVRATEEDTRVKITISSNADKGTFTCKDCNFTGAERPFSEHLMCHLMLRPYQCLHCKECFINRKETSIHVHKAHNGAKLSCALSTPKALKKAKNLIKETVNSGIISFMARVGAKVPLEKDPERPALGKSSSSSGKQKSTSVVQNKDEKIQHSSSADSSDVTSVKETSNVNVKCEQKDKPASVEPGSSQSDGLSKLREVLAAPSPPPRLEREGQLKIVGSYSLQGGDNEEVYKTSNGRENVENSRDSASPSSNSSFDKPPQITSVIRSQQVTPSGAPSLAPPPLIPAPVASHDLDFPAPPKLKPSTTIPAQSSVKPVQPTKKDPNFFVCGFNCLFSSLSAEEYREHTTNFHSTEAFLPCFHCGHHSSNEDDLVRHVADHADSDKSASLYVCGNVSSDSGGICTFGTNMVGDYVNHIRSVHPDIQEPVCHSCGDHFPDVTALQKHAEENVLHIVNCPYCPSKATERRAILNHITAAHPGKPKMVSVAKQLICRPRKINNYAGMMSFRNMQPPTLTPAPSLNSDLGGSSVSPRSTSVVNQILSQYSSMQGSSAMSDILSGRSGAGSHSSGGPSPSSTPDLIRVKDEVEDIEQEECFGFGRQALTGAPDDADKYIIDENGIRRRIYVPMSERQAENFKCNHCTFIARDMKRLQCHERSHGMPPTKKDRFKCIFCPQGFDSEMKFRLHITCHPGDIRFLMYRCLKCEFDTNKKDVIVKHITCNRDRKHRGVGPVEAQYATVSRWFESRVLVCDRCDYMTRHKIHMAIHYQRAHCIIRDKGEFVIPGLTPHDTPVSSFEEERGANELEDSMSTQEAVESLKSTSPAAQTVYTKPSSTPATPSPLFSKNSSPGGFGGGSSTTTILSTPSLDFVRPTGGSGGGSGKRSRSDQPVMTVSQINERNDLFNKMVSENEALAPGQVLENQVRKFKCPICEYLLPKAADLKNHVKRHSEVGQITLTMYRCKYCSCMSTAKTLLYQHLGEKHPGKQIALVKKIVAIDTAEVDKSFAETSVDVNLDQLEEDLHQEITVRLNDKQEEEAAMKERATTPTRSSFEQLFVIPDGGERFEVPLQCPRCSFSSHEKTEIINHVNGLHPEVKVIGSDEDVDRLARETKEELQQQRQAATAKSSMASASSKLQSSQEDVLIVPDEPVFKEPALCSRCSFTTLTRKDMVTHLQVHHPDISIMGRNSYPMQVASLGKKSLISSVERQMQKAMESCVVGSGSLDSKIKCLYDNFGTQMRCKICGTERPKKFFIHVHILRHLNVYLWKCAYCSHRGLQKYKMVDHIKKVHPGKALSVRYLRVNVEARVRQFLEQFDIASGRPLDPSLELRVDDCGDGEEGMGSSSRSSSPSTFNELSSTRGPAFPGGIRVPPPPAPLPSGQTPIYTLGSEVLDERIKCLYDNSDGIHFKCMLCPNTFQRRFAAHRHLIMSHLKTNLLKCAHCSMESVERHVLIDHSLACHPKTPITILPLELDMVQIVSDFLTKFAAREVQGSTIGKHGSYHSNHFGKQNNFSSSFKKASRPFNNNVKFRFGNYPKPKEPTAVVAASSAKKKAALMDPDVIMLGRDALDRELKCLYQHRPNGAFRCLVCRWEFPRKYPLHRHMMLKHLRLMLVGCPYCPFEGVEKYSVSTHIKEEHKDMPISIKYTSPDVRSRVKEFVDDMALSGGSRFGSTDLIKKPTPSSARDRGFNGSEGRSTELLVPKVEKNDDEDYGDDSGGDNDEDDNEGRPSMGGGGGGLVVAMFGKKKTKPTSIGDGGDGHDETAVKVKSEIEDDEYGENGLNLCLGVGGDDHNDEDYNNGDENGFGEDGEESMAGGEGNYDDEDEGEDGMKRETNEIKNVSGAYVPGSYRIPMGGKPKALDVTTNIKVLKSQEGGIAKYYCEVCKFTSLHRSNIVRHIYKIHEKYQTHTCPVCHYQTLSQLLMEGHMQNSHPGVEYTLDSFNINPPRNKSRSTSNYRLGKTNPIIGPLSFQKRHKDMMSEMGQDGSDSSKKPSPAGTSKGPKQFACAYCHYETDTQDDILRHTMEMHSGGGGVESNGQDLMSPSANACWDGSKKAIKRSFSPGAAFSSDSSFREPYPPQPNKRRRRFVFEKGDELYHCLDCSARETSMGRMEEHCAYEHAGQPMNVKRIPAWRFVCKSCPVKTMATSKMKYHLNRHCSYRPYTCSTCGAYFPSPDQCRRHSRSQGHDEQYVYVKANKKEERVDEMLQETRELALTIQNAAILDPEFNINKTDEFISGFQDRKQNLKRSVVNKKSKKRSSDGGEGPPKKGARIPSGLSGLLPDSQPENVTIRCHTCKDFTAPTVFEVREHHRAVHSPAKFYWQDVERGFVCDTTGEALPEHDGDVPSDSTDVGYTTKMSLGAGASPMRFKCKTCDFSSHVIQAMKSHLKSHQPKGFMCAYCSRSFSGKDKLTKHQQCLHPGMSVWTIHLRRLNTPSSGSAKSRALPAPPEPARKQTAKRTGPKASAGYYVSDDTIFVCHECDFTSDSLFHFRRHLANRHVDTFSKRTKREMPEEDSPLTCGYCSFPAETESEFSEHLESHFAARTHQCSHCEYSAYERNSVLKHISSKHPEQEVKVVDIAGPSTSARGVGEGGGVANSDGVPLVLDMVAQVNVVRITEKELLEKYGCDLQEVAYWNEEEETMEDSFVEGGDSTFVEEGDNSFVEEADESLGLEDEEVEEEEDEKVVHKSAAYEHDEDYVEEEEEEDEEEETPVEDDDEESAVDDISDFINDDEEEEEAEEEEEEEEIEEERDEDEENNELAEENSLDGRETERKTSSGKRKRVIDSDDDDDDDEKVKTPDELAREFGLVGEDEDEQEEEKITNGSMSPILSSDTDRVILEFDGLSGNSDGSSNKRDISRALKDRKDATLLSAQIDEKEDIDDNDENDDDDDDNDDEVTFDTDITLASPLPMISLGDGVALSPVNMGDNLDSADMLLDV